VLIDDITYVFCHQGVPEGEKQYGVLLPDFYEQTASRTAWI